MRLPVSPPGQNPMEALRSLVLDYSGVSAAEIWRRRKYVRLQGLVMGSGPDRRRRHPSQGLRYCEKGSRASIVEWVRGGASGGNRTPDPQFTKLPLCRLSYGGASFIISHSAPTSRQTTRPPGTQPRAWKHQESPHHL